MKIFTLNNVCVEFTRHSLNEMSLRSSIGAKLKRKQVPKIKALNNISLEINEGEHIGIIGKNGAGKSTLLKVLAKVIYPAKGKVKRNNKKAIVPLLELGIGFQGDLSGRENCILAGLLLGFSVEEIECRMDSIIKFAELQNFIDEPVKNYSSGMYARLAFAIATEIHPEVLLVDEIFGVGDEFFMRKSMIRMQRLMARGITTVFVSHNIDFLVEQCNRLIWLDKGDIVMDGDP
ncbi:MAG: ABC transporter ATP-binding protein, partial [Ignavibacteria bacterium]|nr:ABC transporter ATP-binding protein [Ignavibacteria bacterium]